MPEYTVFVDDNFHYMDEEERYRLAEYTTCAEAVEACKNIVDQFLEQSLQPGMTADELYRQYVQFGEDPFIHTMDSSCTFSAWQYARSRCDELLNGKT